MSFQRTESAATRLLLAISCRSIYLTRLRQTFISRNTRTTSIKSCQMPIISHRRSHFTRNPFRSSLFWVNDLGTMLDLDSALQFSDPVYHSRRNSLKIEEKKYWKAFRLCVKWFMYDVDLPFCGRNSKNAQIFLSLLASARTWLMFQPFYLRTKSEIIKNFAIVRLINGWQNDDQTHENRQQFSFVFSSGNNGQMGRHIRLHCKPFSFYLFHSNFATKKY